MQLTTEMLARFVGGQLDTHTGIGNPGDYCVRRGEIESAIVEGGSVKVKFAWRAKSVDGSPPWIKDDNLDYATGTDICIPCEINEGLDGFVILTGETTIFIPPNGDNLNPAEVEGLVLAV